MRIARRASPAVHVKRPMQGSHDALQDLSGTAHAYADYVQVTGCAAIRDLVACGWFVAHGVVCKTESEECDLQAYFLAPGTATALALFAGFLSRLLLAFDQQDRALALYIPQVNLTRALHCCYPATYFRIKEITKSDRDCPASDPASCAKASDALAQVCQLTVVSRSKST